MAIDTIDKRASAASVGMFEVVIPWPEGTVGDEDRPHLCWVYNGLTFAGGVVAATDGYCPQPMLRRRRRGFVILAQSLYTMQVMLAYGSQIGAACYLSSR